MPSLNRQWNFGHKRTGLQSPKLYPLLALAVCGVVYRFWIGLYFFEMLLIFAAWLL